MVVGPRRCGGGRPFLFVFLELFLLDVLLPSPLRLGFCFRCCLRAGGRFGSEPPLLLGSALLLGLMVVVVMKLASTTTVDEATYGVPNLDCSCTRYKRPFVEGLLLQKMSGGNHVTDQTAENYKMT